jgi:hypothetical protein
VSTLPPFNLNWPAGNQAIVDFNNAMPAIVNARPKVTRVDLWPLINVATDMFDDVHLNCSGEGKLATLFANVLLGTTPQGPNVVTIAATSISYTSVTMNGNLVSLGSASSVTVGFYWGTSPTLVGATNTTVATFTSPQAFNLPRSTLNPFTTYYFQAWATGPPFSVDVILSFTTLTNIVTNVATSIASTTAILNGNLLSLGQAGSVSIGFLWGTSPTLAGATNTTVATASSPQTFNLPLANLVAVTGYYFRSWSTGTPFTRGAILSFTTLVSPPSPPPPAAGGTGGGGGGPATCPTGFVLVGVGCVASSATPTPPSFSGFPGKYLTPIVLSLAGAILLASHKPRRRPGFRATAGISILVLAGILAVL